MLNYGHLICIAFVLFSIQFRAFCHKRIVPYDFPVKEGALSNYVGKGFDNRVTICEVPDSILKMLSTNALLITCLNYPLIGNFTAYDNLQYG